jgi:hypothetical protein
VSGPASNLFLAVPRTADLFMVPGAGTGIGNPVLGPGPEFLVFHDRDGRIVAWDPRSDRNSLIEGEPGRDPIRRGTGRRPPLSRACTALPLATGPETLVRNMAPSRPHPSVSGGRGVGQGRRWPRQGVGRRRVATGPAAQRPERGRPRRPAGRQRPHAQDRRPRAHPVLRHLALGPSPAARVGQGPPCQRTRDTQA